MLPHNFFGGHKNEQNMWTLNAEAENWKAEKLKTKIVTRIAEESKY